MDVIMPGYKKMNSAAALKAGEEAAKDLAGKKKRPAAVDIDAMMKQMKDAARKADEDAKKAAEG
jgi:hypothetical protein|tara:strand:- start:12 stop:203 length:192 start_codon:yes stop_codon:yes gene_type:complete